MQSLTGAAILACTHLFAGRLRFLDVIPRSRWLSISGGVAVSYALVHLLPELQHYQDILAATASGGPFRYVAEHLVWVLLLAGLVIFYGLEKAASCSRRGAEGTTESVFWLHIAAYAVYNALLGYLLVREDRDLRTLILFVLGIGLHFLVNDHALRHHHRQRYQHLGRWLLAAAIFVGWAAGAVTEFHEAITASVVAFLAGGILLNTFKEELPKERESRFWAFALGAFGYAAILLAI